MCYCNGDKGKEPDALAVATSQLRDQGKGIKLIVSICFLIFTILVENMF